MKSFILGLKLLSLSSFVVTGVVAQNANLGAPANGTSVAAGSDLVVTIDQPDTLSSSTNIGVAIGLFSCANFPCPGPSQALGTILYNGPFNPQFAEPPDGVDPPHENFTVTIPASFPKGSAQLGVAHFALVGASEVPSLETFGVILSIV